MPHPHPELPTNVDFIALHSPQIGYRIGDSCPALPSYARTFGDIFGDSAYCADLQVPSPVSYTHLTLPTTESV